MAGFPAQFGRETARLTALSALTAGAPYALTQSAGGALFLVDYGAEALPAFFLAVAVSTMLIGLGWLRLDWLDILRLAPLLTAVRAVMAAGIGIVLMLFPTAEASAFAAVWARVDFAFGALVFGSLVNRQMGLDPAPEARTLFGAAESVALIGFALAIPLLLTVAAPAELFFAAALSLTLGLLLTPRMQGALFSPTQRPGVMKLATDQAARRRLSPSLRRYLALISAVMLTASAAHFLIDFAYLSAAAAYAPSVTELTAILAIVLGASGLMSLLASYSGLRRLIARYGAHWGLLSAPIAIGGLAALTFLLDAATAAALPILIFLAAMKAVERAVMRGLHRPALRAVLQPAPDIHRARMTQWAEMLGRPIFAVVAALGLILLTVATTPGPALSAGLLIGFSALWAAFILAVRRGYVSALERALTRRQVLGDITDGAADRRSRELIQSILRRGVTDDVIGAARIQAALDPDGFANTAPRLIARGDADVVKELVTTVKEVARPDFYPPMYGRLSIEDDPTLRDALLTAVAATGHPNAPRLLAKALAESPNAPPMGALVGLGRHGGAFGAAIAGQFLERRAISSKEGLSLALDAITAIGDAAPSGPVAEGLRSQDRRLRRSAIRAAGRLKDPAIAPLVVERLSDSRERRAAQIALSGMGEAAIDALAVAAGERKRPERERAAAILALGAIGAPEALDHVLRYFDMRRLSLQATAALALWRAGYIAPRDKAEIIQASSQAMMSTAAEAALARAALAGEGVGALDDALRTAMERAVVRSVRAAGLMRPRGPNDIARLSGHFSEHRDRAKAMDLAKDYLSPALRPILALIRSPSAEARDASLRGFVGKVPDKAEDWLIHLVTRAPWATDFLRALSLAAFAKARPDNAIDLADAVENPGPILANTLETLAAEARGEPQMTLSTIETMLVLKATDLFSQVPEEDLAEMAPYLSSLHLDPEEEVICEGEIGEELYILVSGEVRVIRGGEEIGLMRDGEVFGDLSALDPEPRAATIITNQPSHILALSNEHLMALFEANMEIASGVIAVLVRRLRKATSY